MILTSCILSAALALGAPIVQEPDFEASAVHVAGEPFRVHVSFTAAGPVEGFKLGPAAFELDGKPLGERPATLVELAPGTEVDLSFDIGAHLPATGTFKLGYAGASKTVDVTVFQAQKRGELKFLDMAPEDLARYRALLITNQGPIQIEFWPDVAPNHVRNFLDLVDTGFYDGILFHRVSPTFMIQGGDPNTRDKPNERNSWGMGNGPRRIPAEFSDKKHEPGVLSAARGQDPNSASSQFFIMTAANSGLDGKYSAFGKVLSGMEAVGKIAGAKGEVGNDRTVKPTDPQRIERAYVLPVTPQ
jgi:cyclophilin family peptidyl-prolyl cis-trans isomerase